MTNEALALVVASEVDKAMAGCGDTIANGLVAGSDPDARIDPVTAQLIVNSMRLTMQMAVQLTIRLLEANGVIELPPDGTPLLHLVDEDH